VVDCRVRSYVRCGRCRVAAVPPTACADKCRPAADIEGLVRLSTADRASVVGHFCGGEPVGRSCRVCAAAGRMSGGCGMAATFTNAAVTPQILPSPLRFAAAAWGGGRPDGWAVDGRVVRGSRCGRTRVRRVLVCVHCGQPAGRLPVIPGSLPDRCTGWWSTQPDRFRTAPDQAHAAGRGGYRKRSLGWRPLVGCSQRR
jgi:hypothetical protein